MWCGVLLGCLLLVVSVAGGGKRGSTPHFLWSQTLGTIELAIKVPNPQDIDISFEVPNVVIVECKNGNTGTNYFLKLGLYGHVDGLEATYDIPPNKQSVVVELPKTKESARPWPRLLKSSVAYKTHMSINWEKWIDFQDEALRGLMAKRFLGSEATQEQKDQFKQFQDLVIESGLIDEDEDIDAAIEDLWREKLEQQESEYLEYQNYDFLRKELHELLERYPHGSDMSKMSRTDKLRLEHLLYHYERLQREADALRTMRPTESGMFENHVEREHLLRLAQERQKKEL